MRMPPREEWERDENGRAIRPWCWCQLTPEERAARREARAQDVLDFYINTGRPVSEAYANLSDVMERRWGVPYPTERTVEAFAVYKATLRRLYVEEVVRRRPEWVQVFAEG